MESAPRHSVMRSENATKVLHCWKSLSYAPGAEAVCRYWTICVAETGEVMGAASGDTSPAGAGTPVPTMLITVPGTHLKATSLRNHSAEPSEVPGAGFESMGRL